MSKKSNSFSTRKIVFSAASIGLATVIANYIKLPSLPFGGSTTLFSMLFVVLPGYWFGPVVGICAGIAHGMIQFISNPYVIHPFQVILDYPLAFGALGLSGFFSQKKNGLLKGYLFGVLGRFVFASIAGVIFYTEYVGSLGGNVMAILAGFIYNLSYLGPECILTTLVIALSPVKNGMLYIKKLALGA